MEPAADVSWRGFARQALADLKPFPGRFAMTWRVALLCALVAGVAMLYRVPESAIGCYLIIFLARPNGAECVGQAIGIIALCSIVVLAMAPLIQATADTPFLRLLVIAVASFTFVYLGSASQLGEQASIVALVIAFILTLVDQVPVGEVVTRGLLYAWQMACMPMALMIIFYLIFGTGPHTLLRRTIVERLDAGADALVEPAGQAGQRIDEHLAGGRVESDKQAKLAGLFHTVPTATVRWLAGGAATSYRFLLAVAALPASVGHEERAALAAEARAAAAAISAGRRPASPAPSGAAASGILPADPMSAGPSAGSDMMPPRMARPMAPPMTSPAASPGPVASGSAAAGSAPAGGAPLGTDRAISGAPAFGASASPALDAARGAIAGLARSDGGSDGAPAKVPFLKADAFTNPDHQRYALKTTAAAISCYLIYSLIDWQGIHTAMITCYVAALGTTGETVHKLALRICGCLIGAAIGIASILFVIPHLSSVGGLMALVFLALLPAAWVSTGSERVAYGGVQIGLAFLLTILQGFAPSLDMGSARDRVMGILLGNLVVYLIFTGIWPKSAVREVRDRLAQALGALAALAAMEPAARRAAYTEAASAAAEAEAARAQLALLPFEPAHQRPPAAVVARLDALIGEARALLPLLVFTSERSDAAASRLAAAAEQVERAGDLREAKPDGDGPGGDGEIAARTRRIVHLVAG